MRCHSHVALALAAALAVTAASDNRAAAPRFYDDDPIAVEPDTQDATGVRPWTIDLGYDIIESTFADRGSGGYGTLARSVNTIDEVPDSSWFANRVGTEPITPAEVAVGPDTVKGPAAGKWTIVSAKSDGITPGFTIRDADNGLWFIKFDPPGYHGMATGAEVIVTKLMWLLGYHVPENYIASFAREDLVVGPDATVEPPGGRERSMRGGDVDNLLKRANRAPDGSYRVLASRALPGKPLGGFRFYGTRPDDPNDVIPHEHRRELRGYVVFAAWVNHVDSKSINTLDVLVNSGTRAVVRHYLLDFGSTLGSSAVFPREHWEGFEYLYEGEGIVGKRLFGLGWPVPAWRTVKFFESPAIGRLPADHATWDPDSWRPRTTNPAFRRARADDRFWAARKLAAVTNDMIAAAVRAGQLEDEASEQYLVRALAERRDAIVRAYLPAINPVVEPRLSDAGVLTFTNAAVAADVAHAPDGYRVQWSRFDNATGGSEPIAETVGTAAAVSSPPLPAESGSFVLAEIRAADAEPVSWTRPVKAFFRRMPGGSWKLVGLEREMGL